MTIETSYIHFIANLFEYLGLDDSKDETDIIQLAESLDQYIETTGAHKIPPAQIKSQKLTIWKLIDEYFLGRIKDEESELIDSPDWFYAFVFNSQFKPRKENIERLIETVSAVVRAIEPLEKSFFKQVNNGNGHIDLRSFFIEASSQLRKLEPNNHPYQQPASQTAQMSLTYQECPYRYKLIYRLGLREPRSKRRQIAIAIKNKLLSRQERFESFNLDPKTEKEVAHWIRFLEVANYLEPDFQVHFLPYSEWPIIYFPDKQQGIVLTYRVKYLFEHQWWTELNWLINHLDIPQATMSDFKILNLARSGKEWSPIWEPIRQNSAMFFADKLLSVKDIELMIKDEDSNDSLGRASYLPNSLQKICTPCPVKGMCKHWS